MTSKSQANGRENAGAWSSQQHLWIFDFETWTKIYGSISHHQHPYIMKHKAGTCIVTQPLINTVPTANSHLTSPFTCSRWIINSLSQSNSLQNTLAHFPTFCWRSVLCHTKLLWILRVRRVGKLRKRRVVSRNFRVRRFGCNHLVHSHVLEWALDLLAMRLFLSTQLTTRMRQTFRVVSVVACNCGCYSYYCHHGYVLSFYLQHCAITINYTLLLSMHVNAMFQTLCQW